MRSGFPKITEQVRASICGKQAHLRCPPSRLRHPAKPRSQSPRFAARNGNRNCRRWSRQMRDIKKSRISVVANIGSAILFLDPIGDIALDEIKIDIEQVGLILPTRKADSPAPGKRCPPHDYGIQRNLDHGRRDLPQFPCDT